MHQKAAFAAMFDERSSTMARMDGKVALITGAARGQGRSHALTLAREGADVVAFDLASQVEGVPYPMSTEDDLRQTVEGVEALGRRALAFRGDVRSQSDLDAAVAAGIRELGQIDVVIANAGIWSLGPFHELDDQEWITSFEINTLGVLRTIRAARSHLISRRAGSIIVTSSVLGLEGSRLSGHYVASKHAVSGLAKTVALELAPYGIRCNTVNPGSIDTPMLRWQGAYDLFAGGEGLGSEATMTLPERLPTHLLADRRLLPAAAVSNAVLYLASDESSDVTGVEIPVDAGHMVMPGIELD